MIDSREIRKTIDAGYPADTQQREEEVPVKANRRMRRVAKSKCFVRLFIKLIRDDKLQTLEPQDFRAYILLLCAAASAGNRGILPSMPILRRWLRARSPIISAHLEALRKAGFISRVRGDGARYRIKNWAKHQPASGHPEADLGLWLRLNLDVRYNRKVMLLPAHDFMSWINALCLAKMDKDGILPSLQVFAWELNLELPEAEQQMDRLIGAGLIDVDVHTGKYSPHNWFKWQLKPCAERVKKSRSRKKVERAAEQGSPHSCLNVTPPVTPSSSLSLYLSRNNKRSDVVSSKSHPCKELSVGFVRESNGLERADDAGSRDGPPDKPSTHSGSPGPDPSPFGPVVVRSVQRLPSDPHASCPAEAPHATQDLGDGAGGGTPDRQRPHSWLDLTGTEPLGREALQSVERTPTDLSARPCDAAAQNGQLPGNHASADASADALGTRRRLAEVHNSPTRVVASQAGQRLPIERSANRSGLRRGSHDGINRSNPIQNSQTPVSESLSAFLPRRGKGAL